MCDLCLSPKNSKQSPHDKPEMAIEESGPKRPGTLRLRGLTPVFTNLRNYASAGKRADLFIPKRIRVSSLLRSAENDELV